jgi:hypothetical protein
VSERERERAYPSRVIHNAECACECECECVSGARVGVGVEEEPTTVALLIPLQENVWCECVRVSTLAQWGTQKQRNDRVRAACTMGVTASNRLVLTRGRATELDAYPNSGGHHTDVCVSE